MPAAAEFTMRARPGHDAAVMQKCIAFADVIVEADPDEPLALTSGDAASRCGVRDRRAPGHRAGGGQPAVAGTR